VADLGFGDALGGLGFLASSAENDQNASKAKWRTLAGLN
jgi:hypothetical protein